MKQIIMAALFISFSWGIRAQQLQIRGKVIDLSDKSPLEFAPPYSREAPLKA